MEPFHFNAVRATVCKAGMFSRPLATCLRIFDVCASAFVCVCGSERRIEMEIERERKGSIFVVLRR